MSDSCATLSNHQPHSVPHVTEVSILSLQCKHQGMFEKARLFHSTLAALEIFSQSFKSLNKPDKK